MRRLVLSLVVLLGSFGCAGPDGELCLPTLMPCEGGRSIENCCVESETDCFEAAEAAAAYCQS